MFKQHDIPRLERAAKCESFTEILRRFVRGGLIGVPGSEVLIVNQVLTTIVDNLEARTGRFAVASGPLKTGPGPCSACG